MRFLDRIYWVKKSLFSQKLRASLTIAGFATGIAAVVLMNSMGESLRRFVLDEFTQFGSNIIAVTPGKTEIYGMGGILNTVRPLTLDDSEYLQQLAQIDFVVPVIAGTAKVKSSNRSQYTDVIGVNHMAAKAWQLSVGSGKFLPADDIHKPRNYAVLGSALKQAIFSNSSALGQYIHIGGQRFRVVGVLAEKGQFMGQSLDEMAYIPTATAMQLFNRESLMELDLFYQTQFSSESVAKAIKKRLIHRHGREDFTMVTQDDMLSSLDNILSIVKLAGSGLGMISLFVGAVGIATIMSITVAERTAEIGLLRALGCSSKQIRQLFLYEAVALALISGFIGYFIVMILLFIASLTISHFPMSFNFIALIVALIFSAIIGLIAGIYPAMNAAKLAPIDALRAE